MPIPLLDLSLQYAEMADELDAVWFDTMRTAGFIGGPKVAAFESALADYCGTKHAVSCANGTDALFLILAAAGVGKGDEVITTPFTFWATVEAIHHVGAAPVFVDIEADTLNMDAALLEAAVTPKTKAILPVHIFGQCVDMDTVHDVARRHGLMVFEDACQAIGATYKGARAGGLARAAAFSFFPSKNLGCGGDGGAVTTSDDELAARVRLLANHGSSRKYYHETFGTNSRLDALQAAMLLAKLPYLDRWNAQRRDAAARYAHLLSDVEALQLPVTRGYGESVFHLYIVKAESSEVADNVMNAMFEAGIGTAKYYPVAMHQQPAMSGLDLYRDGSFPVAESCNERTFALPAYPGITASQQEEVARVVRDAISRRPAVL